MPLSAQRVMAKPTRKPIHFICLAQQAREVFITGTFNDWNPRSHPMQRQVDGSWHISVEFSHGSHPYQFLVDGQPMNDPKAHGIIRDAQGNRVSMLMVS